MNSEIANGWFKRFLEVTDENESLIMEIESLKLTTDNYLRHIQEQMEQLESQRAQLEAKEKELAELKAATH